MSTPVVPIFEVEDYDTHVLAAASLLREGKLVVLPTETVYGAAGLLSDSSARQRLKALRGGDSASPLTIHLARREDADHLIGDVGQLGRRMMDRLWPGPVAIQFDVSVERQAEVAAALKVSEAEVYDQGTITLRCPEHPITTDVLSEVPGPVVLTRAGLTADEVADSLGDKVELILDAGPSKYSKPSTIVRVTGEKYEIVREGIYDARIIERLLQTTVLFVCSGNTCRSPMAEAIARRVLADRLKVEPDALESKGLTVQSAGSFAIAGARATAQAVEAVKAFGADLSRHRSRPLSVELIHHADFIYAMGRSHAQAVLSLVPGARERLSLLDSNGDVEDPIGGDLSLYKELAGELKVMIEKRLAEAVPV